MSGDSKDAFLAIGESLNAHNNDQTVIFVLIWLYDIHTSINNLDTQNDKTNNFSAGD